MKTYGRCNTPLQARLNALTKHQKQQAHAHPGHSVLEFVVNVKRQDKCI